MLMAFVRLNDSIEPLTYHYPVVRMHAAFFTLSKPIQIRNPEFLSDVASVGSGRRNMK